MPGMGDCAEKSMMGLGCEIGNMYLCMVFRDKDFICRWIKTKRGLPSRAADPLRL